MFFSSLSVLRQQLPQIRQTENLTLHRDAMTTTAQLFLAIVASSSIVLVTQALSGGVVYYGEVMKEFVFVDYDWPSPEMKSQYEQDGRYNLEHNLISGIKTYQGQIYVTVPRLRYTMGVPSSLNKVVTKGDKTVLQPFPNWEMQELGNCSALQCAMSIEVDPIEGLIYVIDPGRSGLMGKNFTNQKAPILCPAKLVVFDLKDGHLVRSHEFPDTVVNKTTNFLNDIVLDRGSPTATTARWVYITDAADSKLIVFDLQTNESRFIKDSTMDAEPGTGSDIEVNGKTYRLPVPIDGLAMSYDFQFVYYCALGSKILYQVPSRVLRDKNEDFHSNVRDLGPKISQTGGMTYATNNLYYGALTMNGVYRWEVAVDEEEQGVTAAKVQMKTETEIVHDDEKMVWPDSFTVDEYGYLWFTACQAQIFLLSSLDFTGAQGPNYRIWRVKISENGYLSPRGSSNTLHGIDAVKLLSIMVAFVFACR